MKFLHTTSFLIMCIVSTLWLANWSSQESSIDGNEKQRVNFYGTLVTRQNNKSIRVDNISIDHKFRQIPMYEKPSLQSEVSQAITDKQGNLKRQEFMLTVDPRTQLVTTKIDLNETYEIRIPYPEQVWVYQKEQGYRKIEYIEIVIISNNEQKTKSHYLLDLKNKIYCDEINPAGPIEKIVPLQAINSLTIEGYKFRNGPQQKRVTGCTPCVVPQPVSTPTQP